MNLTTGALVGQLLTVGFHGTRPTATLANALKKKERGGVILFKRNLADNLFDIPELNRELSSLSTSSASDIPLLIAVDQEGGRVARVKAPALVLPPMFSLGERAPRELLRETARAQALELAALGFTMNFAPILDVNSRPENPIIGDRAFSSDPETAAARALTYAEGMRDGGILSCGKHFPGHGDTTKDSHIELPRVSRDRATLDRVELLPFRKAAEAGIPSLMSAHVVFDALDRNTPATLSKRICTDLLRGEFGFKGVLFSDDLEMKALSGDGGELAIQSINAGCDALLVCSDEDLAEHVFQSLVREVDSSPAFRARALEAYGRVVGMKSSVPPRPQSKSEIDALFHAHASLRARIQEAIA